MFKNSSCEQGAMGSQSRGEKSAPVNSHAELSSAWRNLNQSKAALRHIENRLEAAVSSGVIITSLDTEKNKHRGRRSTKGDDLTVKPHSQSRGSPDKSSRSPLRTSTQDNTHTSDRHLPRHSDSSLMSGRDVRLLLAEDVDSTRSSALDATTVRVLNDPPTLQKLEVSFGSECSPGSARLEKLRHHQTDEKLEKLKERIRKQREQLEEVTQKEGGRDRVVARLEQPVGIGASHQHLATIRKVAPAPPAPIYKGFNSSDVKSHKVADEEEFRFNQELYKDQSRQLTERVKPQPEKKEKKQDLKKTKPVRKIHRSASVPDHKPAISTASWREGQKLVKRMLGPLPREPHAPSEEREGRQARSSSVPRLDASRRMRTSTTDKTAVHQSSRGGSASVHQSSRTREGERRKETAATLPSRPAEGSQINSSIDLLSADIRGILNDLQLEGGAKAKHSGKVNKRRAGRSPSKPHPESTDAVLPRKRHYDADLVRSYIVKQQEERKRKQAEERRSQREAQERRSHRLQELYRKQKEGVTKRQAPPSQPNRLHETYTKMLLEHTLQQARTVYQPSGESDKENKTLEPLSPSTSELSEHAAPPLCRASPLAGQFFSHLLALEPECAVSIAQPPEQCHADARGSSRLHRVEALRACAASLSNRIESEARKLISYGSGRDFNAVPMSSLLDGDHTYRVKPLSPPEREQPNSSSRCQDDVKELPGVGNLYGFRTQEVWGESVRPELHPSRPNLSFKKREVEPDSSGGSISEGLLSEGSESEAGEALDYCPVVSNNRIAAFQKEALHSPYRPLMTSQIAWEELNKGSPNSVINIFTKNLHKYNNGRDLELERSPALRSSLSSRSSPNGAVYEDDFVSHSGSSQSASRNTTALSNGRSSAEKRENSLHHCSPPLSSPSSANSKKTPEKSSERSLVDGPRSASSFVSDSLRSDDLPSSHRNADTNGTLGDATGLSPHSVPSQVPPFSRNLAGSPKVLGSSLSSSPLSARDSTPKAGPSAVPKGPSAHEADSTPCSTELLYAPAVLKQRLSAELNFLDVVEETVRHLSDVERVRAVSLAQQESVSLAQYLKTQTQRQERELQLLQLKTEQESLESQKHLQESRERAAQAHAELRHSLVQSHHKTLMELQESSSKIINQQTETAQHLKEMTEMAHSQMLNVASITPVQQQQQPRPQTDSRTDVCTESTRSHTVDTAESDESSRRHATRSSSVEEVMEEVNTAPDDSTPTNRDSISVEYSQRFDESVTDDELEKSFRSLLPSESHWRGSVERKRQSDEEHQHEKCSSKQDTSAPGFSADQNTFSEFTMTMVKQYMQEEEVRSQHHGSLLRLRHRALKEKTRTELAWLELQKRRLRDKGEDDKMPPIRKKQRGLLLKLQQEQAEIRRLQEVNRAARRERKLLLKQQEEIERIQHTTLKLKEKLRNAGDTNQKSSVTDESEDLTPLTELEVESRSPSPLSVSGSETSSIMKKLKKMNYHADERFLTQRELRLMHWRQQVEAELRRTDGVEPQIKGRTPVGLTQRKHNTDHLDKDVSSHRQEAGQTGRDVHSEDESSLVSSIHTQQESASVHHHGVPSSSSKQMTHSSSRRPDLHSSAPTSEAASDQSDIEGRVLALRAELRRRKAEVQRLKKEQRVRHKERLKAQEASLLKQLESYNNIIEKTKAELREADSSTLAKPQIKTPSSGSQKSRTRTPSLQSSETEHSTKEKHQEWDSETSERIYPESPTLSDEDPPTVTPTPVFGSPERLNPPEFQHDDHTPSTRTAPTEESTNPSEVYSPRSEVIEEDLKSEADASQSVPKSEPLLNLRVESLNLGGVDEDEMDCEKPEQVQADSTVDETSTSAGVRSSDGAPSPEVSPRRRDSEAEGYNEDFESLASSGREENQPSLGEDHEEKSYKFTFSSEEEVEEEISEEELDADRVRTPLEPEFHTKPSSECATDRPPRPQGSPDPPLKDELSEYSIGDRVLVSSVQSGTLRFKGQTSFAAGFWAGVELDASEGSNDGTYDGVSYFQCKTNHGIFAPPDKISRFQTQPRPKSSEEDDHSEDAIDHQDLLSAKNDPGFPPESQEPTEEAPELKSTCLQVHDDAADADCNILNYISNGNVKTSGHITLEFQDLSNTPEVQNQDWEEPPVDILDLLHQEEASRLEEEEENSSEERTMGAEQKKGESLSSMADKLVQSFMSDAVRQFQQIRRTKEEKISAANQQLHLRNHEEPSSTNENLTSFFDGEQDEVPSPERSESPVLGQEELAQRLAELELNREFLHVLSEDQDWFDEDFGLSSRKHTEHKNKISPAEPAATTPAKVHGGQQEEAPLMLVPHTAAEVEKLVSAALVEIWSGCGMDQGNLNLTSASKPQASEALLGNEDEEQCVRSYRQAVFDLSWEFMQDIYAEDPNADQPHWIKPRRMSSSCSHRIIDTADLTKVQEFISGEVLKLYGLRKEPNHRTDWQKMLKFGRKKRDRVDHILVQELHVEEALWVNYDEDELFVKMQLADGVFDALLKDTVDVLIQIHERRSTRALS